MQSITVLLLSWAKMRRSQDAVMTASPRARQDGRVLQGCALTNVCCVVTRYFGGTLLGTGGLIRAYQGAVKEGLANCEIVTRQTGTVYTIGTDYGSISKLQTLFGKEKVILQDTEYGAQVIFTIILLKDQEETMIRQITDVTAGNATIEKGDPTTVDVPWEVRNADGRDFGIN